MAITERFDNMAASLGSFNLNIAYINGDDAVTDMVLTGITTEDEILSAYSCLQSAAGDQSPIPVTDLSITEDGIVQTAVTDLQAATVVIFWVKKTI